MSTVRDEHRQLLKVTVLKLRVGRSRPGDERAQHSTALLPVTGDWMICGLENAITSSTGPSYGGVLRSRSVEDTSVYKDRGRPTIQSRLHV
jgi:hypothetical protein